MTTSQSEITIFEKMSMLAREHNAVNLGQGFPDSSGPIEVRQKAADYLLNGNNQYPPMVGLLELRESIAVHYLHWQNLKLNPNNEVLVTSGATEALAACFLSLIEPGDEVIVFQPFYDSYVPMIKRAGGVPKFVKLSPPLWNISTEALENVVSEKTKYIVFNNPLNPAAKVYDQEQINLLAKFCIQHNLIAICDEVWEHVIFDALQHIPLMSHPQMRDRCIKIGSAGKIFSMTGWKIGFVMACEPLLKKVTKLHQFLTFTTPPNLQHGVAFGLQMGDDYFFKMRSEFQSSRDYLAKAFVEMGLQVLPSQGSYFLNIDLAGSKISEKDKIWTENLVKSAGVAAIPVSAFYAEDAVETTVRFCFAKKIETLDAGIERLSKFLRGV